MSFRPAPTIESDEGSSLYYVTATGLPAGEAVPGRGNNLLTSAPAHLASGWLVLAGFRAKRSEPITKVRTASGGTAAGLTPTLVRHGIYTEDPVTGLLTLVAQTANDTAQYGATSTVYTPALTATWSKVAGQRYAVGTLIVTAAALPTVAGIAHGSSAYLDTVHKTRPFLFGVLSGQAALPATIAQASIAGTTNGQLFELLP